MRINARWISTFCVLALVATGLASAQIVRHAAVAEALEVQRDADAIGGARSPIAVQDQLAHGAGDGVREGRRAIGRWVEPLRRHLAPVRETGSQAPATVLELGESTPSRRLRMSSSRRERSVMRASSTVAPIFKRTSTWPGVAAGPTASTTAGRMLAMLPMP